MRGNRLFPATLAMLVSLGARGQSPGIDEATGAYLQGDHARALSLFEPLAEEGNPLAQYSMANLYASGQGVEQNQGEAVRWLRRAARGGYRRAAVDLGNRYASGLGVERDLEEAAKWFEMAGTLTAEEGQEEAESDCD